MKILVGTFDTAGLLNPFADGFRKLGHEVTTVVRKKNKFYPDSPFDIESDPDGILNTELLSQLIELHDLFVFQWAGESLMPGNKDFRLLKKYGKKIIQIFNGDDVRHHSAYKQWCGIDLTLYSKFYTRDILERPLKNIRTSEYYADMIFSLPNQSSLAIRPYMHSILPVDLSKYKFSVPGRDIPVIVHAPSDENIKGTRVIINALERLKSEGYNYELRLLREVPNSEVISQLYNADIAIDQLYILLYGMFPLEAMASGCAVATIDHIGQIRESFPPDRPIYHIDEKDLYEQLKTLISDKELRIKFAKEGRKFVEKYHDNTKVAGRILDSLNCKDITYDYYPTFFFEKYKLPGSEEISEEMKELTLKIIQRWGIPPNIKPKNLIKQGLIPEKTDPKTLVKKWLEMNSNVSFSINDKCLNLEKGKQKLFNPKFTIAIFTYNRADRIKRSIESALMQKYPDYEVLIVDDGSTDNTEKVVKGYNSKNIRYIKKEHSGISKSRNCAIEEAKGDFIIWLADDDELSPDLLEAYSKYIERFPDADILYCQLKIKKGDEEKIITPKDWYKNKTGLLSALVVGTPLPDGGSAVSKKVYDALGGYNTSFKRAMDYEFWSRVVQSQQFEAKLVDDVTYIYYIHNNNITGLLNPNTDYSFEARILENIVKNNPIELLCAEYNWVDDAINSKAEAFYLIAAKFLSYNDISNAKRYFEKSVKLKPELEFKNAKITQILNNHVQENNLDREQTVMKEGKLTNTQYQKEIEGILFQVNQNNYDDAYYLTKNLLTLSSLKETIGDKEYLELLNLAGSLCLIRQDYEAAQQYFEKELIANPTSSRACIGLGEVYFAAEMFKESKTMFEWAVKYEPQNNLTTEGLAKVNKKLGLDNYHNTLIQEIVLEEIVKSEELIKEDKYDEAYNILQKVLEKHPDNIDALNNSAVAQILIGNYSKALDLIEKVLDIDQNNEIALNNLNYLMSVSGVTLPKN